MPYRFVHSADIHLDSPLRSLALRSPDLADLIGNASRRAFVNIVDLCLEEQVDALLLAGDLYDGDQTSMKTARFLAEQLRRLDEAGICVFIVRGNHDALSRITKELVFPDNVKVFGSRAEALTVERAAGALPVAIHGLSFAKPQAPESLLGKFSSPVDGAINIGLMHTSLGGAPGHDPYAPCSPGELMAFGYDYWALGHIHKRSVLEGESVVVMPGTPQGRDINEAGAKSATLVTIAEDRSINLEERATCIAQFERISVDVTGIDDWQRLVSMIAGTLEQARERVSVEQLVVRLQIDGASSLAWRIRRDADLLKTEADDRASVLQGCWIENLDIRCRPQEEPSNSTADPIEELRRLIRTNVMSSDVFNTEVKGIADELLAQLPPECRNLLGSDETLSNEALRLLVEEGAEDVLARLHADASSGD